MKIIKGNESYLDEIMTLLDEVKQDPAKLTDWDDDYPDVEIIQEDLNTKATRLLVIDGLLVGYVVLSDSDEYLSPIFSHLPRAAFLSRLVIKKTYRKQGVAFRFMQEIEKEAVKNGYLYFGILITPENIPSIALSEKLGFQFYQERELEWGKALAYFKPLDIYYRFVSWNVNGLRSIMNKGFPDFLNRVNADIVALQEIKMFSTQANFSFPGYHAYWHSASKPGYSGTLVLTKTEPQSVSFDFPSGEHPKEGRIITLEYPDFYFVCVYVPNAQRELTRLDYRMQFEDDFRKYLIELDQKKPVIICGDLNVAHQPIDLKNPKANERNAGFTIEERTKFTELLNSGFIDSFRTLYPEKIEYTWWSYLLKARERNIGWRIDYFLLSERLFPRLVDSFILSDVMGSDHCPVGVILKR
ncbi:MAG: exodeoxyribonuclease III [Bacilli bacterium]|jgi:exodeoxyribonuclease-3|nr:exodeoxyribonuclease III [Acholeplasmataceae bacterium]